MALYIPPVRHRHHISPELLLMILGLLLLLVTLFMFSIPDRTPKERFAPDSAIAATTIIDHKPDDIDIAAQPQMKGSVTMAAPLVTPQLTATIIKTSLEASLRDLLNRPNVAGQYSEIPSGTQLLGVTVKNNTVTVDLSEEFATGGGSTSIIGRVEELKKTVTQVNMDYQVKIAINGKLVEYLGGEGLEVNR